MQIRAAACAASATSAASLSTAGSEEQDYSDSTDVLFEHATLRRACLLAHHGQIAFGPTVEDALHLAHEVETLSAQYWRALQLGEPDLLPDEEMAVNVEKFRNYGRKG